jgi:hypothetical protein
MREVAMVGPNVIIVALWWERLDKLLQASDSFVVLVLQRHSDTDCYHSEELFRFDVAAMDMLL